MNYIGSKLKLSSWIEEEVKNVVGDDLSQKVFCDLFAGTGIVGRTFKNDVKQVISNDIEDYSYILNRNYIQNSSTLEQAEEYIIQLNNLPLIEDGFIYNNYCMGSGSERQYFSDYNGKKIDTIRLQIEKWKTDKKINENMYYFLLASLLESADKVANTASVYGAFLKKLKKSALKELALESANFDLSSNKHVVHKEDSNTLIQKISGDILYLDPPYNQRQYGANYHLLNTITKYDNFTPKGKTGMREYFRSQYCSKKDVAESFNELIKNANFKYIFLSYNNEGLMSEDTTREIMENYGEYKLIKKEYQRFKADKTENRNHKANSTFEYLHVLIKKEL
ncbi:DNA adenine methylase [Sulfurimonas marina]|uniref:site-specific DNA-methyltransferase (adenine-specific) n=1 Tax=Sulfurimonas marina TaxID=2590551 RepID=A0A7M1AWX1_9BACT|nr:DNA adenine methylase [Sulfurimonas marina]QOP41816.1 modification methylase [Sulfurimonas marina]